MINLKLSEFSFSIEEIQELTKTYPNLEEQINRSSALFEQPSHEQVQVCILIRQGEKYFPALLTRKSDGFVVNQALVYHGVGTSGTGDSYTDFKEILNSGFRTMSAFSLFPEMHLENAVILDHTPFSKGYPDFPCNAIDWGMSSRDLGSKGDKFYFQFFRVNPAKYLLDKFPCILLRDCAITFGTYKVDKEELEGIVLINPQISPEEKEQRRTKYKQQFKNRAYIIKSKEKPEEVSRLSSIPSPLYI